MSLISRCRAALVPVVVTAITVATFPVALQHVIALAPSAGILS